MNECQQKIILKVGSFNKATLQKEF